MDKRTVIAVVLAVVVIIGSMLINNLLSPKKPAALPPEKTSAAAVQPSVKPAEAQPAGSAASSPASPAAPVASAQGSAPAATPAAPAAGEAALVEETLRLETDVFRVTFSNRGAAVTSIQLKQYKNLDGSPVEMILPRESNRTPFSIHFGDAAAPADETLFRYEKALSSTAVSFFQTFLSPSGIPFVLRKTYTLQQGDYLIELRVGIENSVNEYPDLSFGGFAYTLGFGPQIGPDFVKLDRQNEYRTYTYFADGKKQDARIPKEGLRVLKGRATWAAIVGKYFEVIAVPDATPYTVTYDTRALTGLKEQSSLYFSRPEIKSSKNTDVFRFYVGPNKREILTRYNDAGKNPWKLTDLKFEESLQSSPIIGWLANILKILLELFYRLIPNYGVAILLLTLLIKLLFWPLTNKSYQSTAKMQALQPKMKELQAKYKANPQKLNQEMAALYKKEGVSPLGGCLPLLLQLPIFFALYNLLSTHFELRGASFIAGWISDLSAPEAIVTFNTVNLMVWQLSALRVLPFLMLGTTFLQSKVSQSSAPTDKNMALMTYAMPIVFFFILYNMPSGLVLYWTAQNLLGIVQQLITNYQRKRKEETGGGEVEVVKRKK